MLCSTIVLKVKPLSFNTIFYLAGGDTVESVIKAITRPMIINGESCTDIDALINSIAEGEHIKVQLKAVKEPKKVEADTHPKARLLTANDMRVNRSYIIKVRQYMTKPASEDFDFQAKWNNNVPMPFRVMQGRVLKETRGMLYMDCHAVPLKTDVCMRCGRPLSHPVSRLYGVGPECGGHAHINPFETEEELYAALDSVKQKLSSIKWRGWIIKSAVEQCQEAK